MEINFINREFSIQSSIRNSMSSIGSPKLNCSASVELCAKKYAKKVHVFEFYKLLIILFPVPIYFFFSKHFLLIGAQS